MAQAARPHDVRTHSIASDVPLRAELLSPDRIADEARGIAATQRWTTQGRPRSTPLSALIETAATGLEADNRELARSVQKGLAASPAAEWLLDNYYLIEEQVLLVREDLPRDYATELPRLTAGPLDGFPRVYEALLALLPTQTPAWTRSPSSGFVEAYQDVSALTIGEVWAVPIMLRIAVVENLRRLSRATVISTRIERTADDVGRATRPRVTGCARATRIAHARVGALPSTPRTNASSLRLSRRLTELETGAEPINAWLGPPASCSGGLARAGRRRRTAGAGREPGLHRQRHHHHPLPRRTASGASSSSACRSSRQRCAEIPRGPTRSWTSRAATATATHSSRWGAGASSTRVKLAEKIVSLAQKALAARPLRLDSRPRRMVAHRRRPLRAREGSPATGLDSRERVYRGPLQESRPVLRRSVLDSPRHAACGRLLVRILPLARTSGRSRFS